MSPKTKKLLMIAGAAVAGYVVYTRVIKKPSAPRGPTTITPDNAASTLKTAAVGTVVANISAALPSVGAVEEDLGSLSGCCF